MLIGDLAKRSDVTPATIRYYEEIGLLTAPPRSERGYRRYSTATLKELEFIKKGQGLGFSLEDIGEILKPVAREKHRVLVCSTWQSGISPPQKIAFDNSRRSAIGSPRKSRSGAGKAMPNCNASGLCEIISSADLPPKR